MINIIGGAGFIGTRLCRRFEQAKTQFKIIDKNKSVYFAEKTEYADVRDYESLLKTIDDKSIIINLAAEHHDNVSPVSLYDDVNVGGAENICKAAREKNVNHIIFTSSVAVYGFAPSGTDETGEINYFNDYGRTKWLAEKIFRKWQQEDPEKRTLVIIRPTVVFGEQNRGNVYNLIKQMASGRFLMVGSGKNRKSMAYVENVASFIESAADFKPGLHLYNYIDKPDFDMNTLVKTVRKTLTGRDRKITHFPYFLGYAGGAAFDLLSALTGKKFTVSRIRVKKFCAETCFNTSVSETGFVPAETIENALTKTIKYEFLEKDKDHTVFYSE